MMKIIRILPFALLGLAACSEPTQIAQSNAQASMVVLAKEVLCIHLKPEALAGHADCAAPAPATQATDAPCSEIIAEFKEKYQQCRAVALGGISLPAGQQVAVIPEDVVAVMPKDVSITSFSDTSGDADSSTTTSVQNGVRSVSIRIGDQTYTLSSDMDPTEMTFWDDPQ